MSDLRAQRQERTRWFMGERFGMFIHWGLYSVAARGEWVKSTERIADQKYDSYLDSFNPDRYDARAWTRAARGAGMRYAVMTAKHHDGFCLFDSAFTDYTAARSRAGRDLIREYVEAFRAEGLRVGLYYSLIDWHHPDYPAYGDRAHPLRDNESCKGQGRDITRYVEYLHGQVRELLSNYGRIDIMWFDFSYDSMTDETWRASELVRMARSLQPHLIIDNRLSSHEGSPAGGLLSPDAPHYAGDFASPEQVIPNDEGVQDRDGRPVPWESCITLNDHWGYAAADTNWKKPWQIVRVLVECVSKGGNLLVNVGPTAHGEIPAACLETMDEVGRWLRANGASIYGCGPANLPKPEWGRYTARDNTLYAHVLDPGIGKIIVKGLLDRVRAVHYLADGAEITMDQRWYARQYPGCFFIEFPRQPMPDPIDTVIEIELA